MKKRKTIGKVTASRVMPPWKAEPASYFQQFVPLPKSTRLDAEILWDNLAANPRNPSSPPVRLTWGEESKDEMDSISLIAVAHEDCA